MILCILKQLLGPIQTGYEMTLFLCFQQRFQIVSQSEQVPLGYSCHPPDSGCVKDTKKFTEPLQRQAMRMTLGQVFPFPLGHPSRAEDMEVILHFVTLSQIIWGLQKNHLESETCILRSLKAAGTSPSIMSEKSK